MVRNIFSERGMGVVFISGLIFSDIGKKLE